MLHSLRRQWSAVPAVVAVAAVAALLAAIIALPGSRILAQTESVAVPPCGEVLGIGGTTDSCLRVVHTSAAAGPVDVYAGENAIVQGLAYGQTTEFVAVPGGQQELRAVPAGGTLEQAGPSVSDELGAGAAYQLTMTGLEEGGLGPWLSGVDVSPLPQGQARVRAVHASPDTDEIDVAVAGGETAFSGVTAGSQSGYVPFSVGSYTFQLRQSGDDTLLLETPPVQIEEGANYDIYVIGESEAGTLEMVVLAAGVGVSTAATPAAVATPVLAVGGTPVVVTPGASTPAATPTS